MAPAPDERRVVTALFADIVGSTALAERHDPEEARLIVGEAIARGIRIVEAYGGTVKDLAGDGMLALFGAPVAHEDDPERALRAGLEIAAEVSAYAVEVRRGWSVEGFGVRLGAETGEVVAGEIGAGSRVEYGATGDAVNVAARLQAAAEPGTLLVGPRARRLVQGTFEWGPDLRLELKGKAEPVVAAVATAVSRRSERAGQQAPLTGREEEMGLLAGALAGVEAGRGGIVFLAGEPGIGKSRLTAELRTATADAGAATWLEGRAVSYGASLAWWPIRDLLRTWVGVGTQEPELRVRLALRRRLEELLPGRELELQPFLAAVLGLAPDPGGAAALAGLSPEALQYRTYEVITEVVGALAARRPVVLAIEDLHWADATSLGLLDRLLPLAESAPVLLLFNHRPDTEHPSWMLREHALREFRHLVTVVDLRPLDPAAELRLLEALGEGAMSDEDARRIAAYAEGNPLFLEELARVAAERGDAEPVALPTTLEGVILARLDRLEPEWRRLLTAASVCGRTFSAGLLRAVAEVGEEELRGPLHHLLRLDLLNEERRWPEASYRFKHALIQEAAYRTVVTPVRRELHRRAAGWLTERYADGAERVYGLLAHHWLEAADLEQASGYLRLAGEQALAEWSLDEAIRHLGDLVRVLRRTGREGEAARPLLQLAFTLHLAMRFKEADDAWREAASLGRPPVVPATPTASLVLGVNRVPWDADPLSGYYAANLRLTLQLNEALFTLRPGPSVEPRLAQRLEVSASGLAYRVHLRPGLTFNSGRPLSAATVVAGIKEFLRVSGDSTMLWGVTGARRYAEGDDAAPLGVAAADETTVELTLDRPDPGFPVHLAIPQLGCVVAGESTGPYRLAEMGERRVVIEAEPTYPRPRPGNVARVEWRLEDVGSVSARLAAGDIDAIVNVGNLGDDAGPGMVEAAGPPLFMCGLWPTWQGPPVDEPLRQALARAVDRSRIQPLLHHRQQAGTGGLVPPGLPGHTPGIAPAFEPDEARRWLAMSGHRGPLRACYYVEALYPSLQGVLDCWSEVLGLEIERVPISIPDNREAARTVHVIQMNWVAHVPDPSYFLHELFRTGSRANLVGVSDPELDVLLDRAHAATNGAQRLALYHEADRHAIAARALLIPVFYGRMFSILQPWVQGWWEWGNPNQLFSEVTVLPGSPRAGG